VAAGSGGGASTTQAGGRAGTPAAETLLEATQRGDVAEVRRVSALGVNVDERDADGDTALHWAAANGHMEVMRVLVVELGADKDAKNAGGATPLHEAAFIGHVEAMRVLVVELGADKGAKNAYGVTPLHAAAFKGRVEAIKALEQLGAQIDAQAANGETPLKVSIRMGHHQAAQVLRELERTARARKEAATSERAQQAAKAEAQSKVRGVELAPVCGVGDAVSLAHGWVVSSEVPAAGFLWRC
jgi:ankyrin repeat protein